MQLIGVPSLRTNPLYIKTSDLSNSSQVPDGGDAIHSSESQLGYSQCRGVRLLYFAGLKPISLTRKKSTIVRVNPSCHFKRHN
jgi:hypothetical protein